MSDASAHPPAAPPAAFQAEDGEHDRPVRPPEAPPAAVGFQAEDGEHAARLPAAG